MSTTTSSPTLDGVKLSSASIETVSVVIPCYNEEQFIGKALEQLAKQYEPEHYEIIVVDGMSTDATRSEVWKFKEQHPELALQLIDNPARNIPNALNIGVAAAHGEIIARMDAHAVPSSGYIRRCVQVLTETSAGAVGMPCHVQPSANTLMAQAIALAVSHPFGIGDAKYRLVSGEKLQEPVDTVAFACFRKSLWSDLNGFDESLLTNEDYEFNYRVRASGKEVLLDRSGHCDYFARGTLAALMKQYWRYGGWKARMIRLHPRSIKLRQLVAPAFLLSLIAGMVGSLFWPSLWLLLAAEVLVYGLVALLAAIHASRANNSAALVLLLPIVFCCIHLTWGTSFLVGLVRPRASQ